MTPSRILAAALATWMGFCMAGEAAARFKARLATVPMDAAMRSTVAGTGSASATLTGNRLTVHGAFEGLRSPATTAQIHLSRVMGIRGPRVFDLTVEPSTKGSLQGALDLTPAQIADLNQGKLYIQIDSEKAPEGNLWGWLLR